MTEQLEITLGLEIIFVSGTVNGAVAGFSLTAPGIWSAVVPKLPDGRYEIDVTAYNSLGTPAYYHTVVYRLEGLIPFKTDWTKDDYYGPEDLNRVEANTGYIAEQLELAGYPVELEIVTVDRDMAGYEFADSLSRVESNIDALVTGFMSPLGYQTPKMWSAGMRHSYIDANRVEQNLQLLYNWLTAIVAGFKRCGALTCGDEGGGIF